MGFTSDPAGTHVPLLRRVDDAVRLCEKRGAPAYLGFLDEGEQVAVRQHLSRVLPDDEWTLYGGYPEAVRRVLAVFPAWLTPQPEDLPVRAVGFAYRPERAICHRDVLGTLLSLGLRRETVGDILCGSGLSVAFLRAEVCAHVLGQVDRIGGEGVRLLPDYDGELPALHRYRDLRDTVASPRLDAVLAALLGLSRERAAQLIRTGAVEVDHVPAEDGARALSAPCTLSVRGHGRFLVDAFGPPTKKGRLTLAARQCI